MKKLLLIMLTALVIASGAWAQGTVTRGPLEFTFNADIASPTTGNADLLWNGVDQLFQLWFWYRCPGESFETPFPIPDSQGYMQAGGWVGLDWNDICGEPAFAQIQLLDCSTDDCSGAGPGSWGQVYVYLQNSPTPPAGPTTFFVYFDFDLAGDSGFDSALSLGSLDMRIQDEGTIVDVLPSGQPHLRQVTPFEDLRLELNDAGLTDLDGTGLPFGPGDFTGAIQKELWVGAHFNVNPPIFADGFESGDVSGWSSTVGLTEENIGVFVSSDSFFGDFGGLAFADATCEGLGTAAMPGSGPWVAWLSEQGTDARVRIPQPSSGGAYVRASQPATVIANDLADLTDGSLDLAIGNLDEVGNPLQGFLDTWTGTNTDGTVGADTCQGWTANSIIDGGISGFPILTDSGWTDLQASGCDQELHLYCFGALGESP